MPDHPRTPPYDRLLGHSKDPRLTIYYESLGTPGARITLKILPKFEPPRSTDAEALTDASPRHFVVAARLCKAPLAVGDIKGDFNEEDGGSYLLVPPGKDCLQLGTPWGICIVRKNGATELSLLEFECEARSHMEARVRFLEAVAPALDHISYTHNVPLFVTMIRVLDTKHQSTHIDVMSPYRRQVVPDQNTTLFEEMKPIYAMYREAKNADSDFYRFLCFYKIMDGLLGRMRASVRRKAKEHAIELDKEKDLVPDDPDIVSELRCHVGTPIRSFFGDVLTAKFRNAVAHFTTSGDRVLHVSSVAELYSYANIAFLCDLCVRVLIARHEAMLAMLRR